jgi:transposase-like protein
MIFKCPNCKSKDVRKRGFRFNKVGKKQKYQCFDCKKWFVEDDGFKRMRHNKKIIARAIHMHIDGFSLYKTQYHLWQHDGIKITRKTINDWTKKYSVFLKSDTSPSSAKNKRKIAF